MSDDDITSLTVRVEGFVQGVGFRDFLVMAAEAQKLDGWVRNRSDGTVEALVSGPTKAVEIFVTNATKGPPGATSALFERASTGAAAAGAEEAVSFS